MRPKNSSVDILKSRSSAEEAAARISIKNNNRRKVAEELLQETMQQIERVNRKHAMRSPSNNSLDVHQKK